MKTPGQRSTWNNSHLQTTIVPRGTPEFSTLGCFAPRPLSPLDNPAEPLPFPKVAAFGLTDEFTGFHSFADFSTV